MPQILRPKLRFCVGRLVKETNDLSVLRRRAGRMFGKCLKNIHIDENF